MNMKTKVELFKLTRTIDIIPNLWISWNVGFDIGISWICFNLVLNISKK